LERWIDPLQSLAVEVCVGVDEAGDDGGTGQVEHARPPALPRADIGPPARGADPPGRDGQGRRDGPARIEGDDPAGLENPVGLYFIHPFSRYARSARGWRGTPTFAGSQAVWGSNSARPA